MIETITSRFTTTLTWYSPEEKLPEGPGTYIVMFGWLQPDNRHVVTKGHASATYNPLDDEWTFEMVPGVQARVSSYFKDRKHYRITSGDIIEDFEHNCVVLYWTNLDEGTMKPNISLVRLK